MNRRYPSYQDSGVDTVGSIPEGWIARPLKAIATFVAGGTPDTENSLYWEEEPGGTPWVAISDMSGRDQVENTAKTLTASGLSDTRLSVGVAGTVLFAMYASVGEVAQLGVPAAWNQAILGITPKASVASARYLYYSLKAANGGLPLLYRSNTQNNLNAQQVSNLKVPAPPLDQQQQIADYLDAQTAKIDALIGKQERLIETLAERRQAVISHAVTKGLDPSVPMKDSGVDWIGVVPRDWAITKVKTGYRVVLGKMLDAARADKVGDEPLPYIRAGNIHERGLDLSDVNTMNFTPSERASLSLRASDLLVVEGGAVGVRVLLKEDMPGWSFQKTVNRVRARTHTSTAFLGYFLDMIRLGGVIDMLCNKSTIAHFTAEKLNATEVALPPLSEQDAIAAHLDRETSQMDALSAKAREMIDVLKERRHALISAAVTGKIDVRGLA